MSKRAENLENLLRGLDEVENVVDTVANTVFGKINELRAKANAEYQRTVANDQTYADAEKRAQEVVDQVVKTVKNFTGNPNFKNFVDTVVKPAKTPGEAVDDAFGGFDDVVLSRDEKIAHVKQVYREQYGIEVWPNPDNISDEMVEAVYTLVSK